MHELTDIELRRVRLRFIDLIKSFFLHAPDAERLSRWRGTFSALAGEPVTPLIDQAVLRLNAQLTAKKLEDLEDEYYALFIDPFSPDHVNLMASHYIDGRNHGDTLIAFRQFLAEAGLAKIETVGAPEDSLPIMLDVLANLIEQEKYGDDTQLLQGRLVTEFLSPFVARLGTSVAGNGSADFYGACIVFCRGYLDLEKGIAKHPA